jgi:hypothetical protein
MPSVLTLGTILVALALNADAPLQEKLYDATVKVPEALVRSGASDDPKMYATNRLHQGDVVEVVKEVDGGWLAIKPPKGSFSWINTRFLDRDPKDTRVWYVHGEVPVDVLLGSELVNAKPSVVGKRMSPGSIVVAVGQALDDKQENDGRFLPIASPEGELRYVRADQVARAPAPGQAALVPPPAPGGGAPAGPPTPAGDFSHPAVPAAASAPLPPPTVGSNDPRWLEAQRLEQEGRKAEAAQKYTELAQQVCAENHDLAMQCYNRAYFLRESAGAGAAAPPADPRLGGAAADNRLAPVPAGTAGQQVNYASLQDPAAGAPPQTSTPGLLRAAGRGVDSRRTYVLQDSRGMIQMYVTGQPGVDLESYVGRNVQLYGPLVYRMDIRAYYMNAQRITPLQ